MPLLAGFFWYWCYYVHWSRDALSPACRIKKKKNCLVLFLLSWWPYLNHHKWTVQHSCDIFASFHPTSILPASNSWLPSIVIHPTRNKHTLFPALIFSIFDWGASSPLRKRRAGRWSVVILKVRTIFIVLASFCSSLTSTKKTGTLVKDI